MIRGTRIVTIWTYSQTLNRWEVFGFLIEPKPRISVLSGPFLVSRTGDAG